MSALLFALLMIATPAMAADGLPPCARSGSMSMTINGKPALRLSDVADCPPGSWTVIPGITIENQPMVHMNAGMGGCAATASPDVQVGGQAANRQGDVVCP